MSCLIRRLTASGKIQIKDLEQNSRSCWRTARHHEDEERRFFGAGFIKSAALAVIFTEVSTISTGPSLLQFSVNIIP